MNIYKKMRRARMAAFATILLVYQPPFLRAQSPPHGTGLRANPVEPEVVTQLPVVRTVHPPSGKETGLPKERVRSMPPSEPVLPPTPVAGQSPRIPSQTGSDLGDLHSTITTARPGGMNHEILAIISQMPHGGGYSVRTEAKRNLIKSIRMQKDGTMEIGASLAKPSFCSSATYLVFLQAILKMEQAGQLRLSDDQKQKLLVGSQPDGVGVWGRWNANGPGTAKLFHDLGIGFNFTTLSMASAGDFLKIWWTDQIGAREKGHSVIYLGVGKSPQGENVLNYWSSNLPDGYGQGSAPFSRIKHLLFSRFDNLQGLKNLTVIPARDAYLASMLQEDENRESMLKKVGTVDAPRRP